MTWNIRKKHESKLIIENMIGTSKPGISAKKYPAPKMETGYDHIKVMKT